VVQTSLNIIQISNNNSFPTHSFPQQTRSAITEFIANLNSLYTQKAYLYSAQQN